MDPVTSAELRCTPLRRDFLQARERDTPLNGSPAGADTHRTAARRPFFIYVRARVHGHGDGAARESDLCRAFV
jgi:hypothetical protein